MVALTVPDFFCFLDRGNIGNAKIQGMTEDLDLDVGNRYNLALFVSLSYLVKHSYLWISSQRKVAGPLLKPRGKVNKGDTGFWPAVESELDKLYAAFPTAQDRVNDPEWQE